MDRANDSDIVAFGGIDVVYDWDPFARSYRRVRLLRDLLGKVVKGRRWGPLGVRWGVSWGSAGGACGPLAGLNDEACGEMS